MQTSGTSTSSRTSGPTTTSLSLWFLSLLVLGISLSLPVSSMPVPTAVPGCSASEVAQYRLTFTGKWTQSAFPKQYPVYRPPAQWSSLIGVTHSRDFLLWRPHHYASVGVREFSERGEAWTLLKEVDMAGQQDHSVHTVLAAAAGAPGSGQMETLLEVVPRHSYLSFMVRLVPSPDWFVGVDGVDLCDGDRWRESVSMELYPYDAGTDSGFTFSSPNYETIPQDRITQITSSSPSHPANSFFYPRLKQLPPIAKVTLTRTTRTNQILPLQPEPTQSNQLPTGNEIQDTPINTPLDCELSVWSPWGLCSGPCGGGGLQHRSRYIVTQPANHGAACPLLEEDRKCTQDNCL